MNISVESVTDLQTNEGTARMHVHFVPNILDINTVRNTARTRAGRRKELGLVVLLVREGSSSLKPMMLDATRTPCRCNGRRTVWWNGCFEGGTGWCRWLSEATLRHYTHRENEGGRGDLLVQVTLGH